MSGPGDLLRKARESAGLSTARVAEDLHLKEVIISALEADDYDALPEPPYVRGYLKAYAKLVGANESQVLERYGARFPTPVEPELAPDEKLPADYTPLAKLGFLLLIVGVIAAAFWWFTIREPEPVSARAENPAVEESAAVDTPMGAVGMSGARSPSASTGNTVGAGSDEETTSAADTPAGAVSMSETESPNVGDEPPVSSESVTEAPASTTEPEQETPSSPAQEETAAEPAPVPGEDVANAASSATGDRMVMVFTEASWVEVRDSGGAELLYGLVPAGGERRVSGPGPFRIFLGNAPGVQVRVNGEAVDFQARIRADNTARFRAP